MNWMAIPIRSCHLLSVMPLPLSDSCAVMTCREAQWKVSVWKMYIPRGLTTWKQSHGVQWIHLPLSPKLWINPLQELQMILLLRKIKLLWWFRRLFLTVHGLKSYLLTMPTPITLWVLISEVKHGPLVRLSPIKFPTAPSIGSTTSRWEVRTQTWIIQVEENN